MTLIKLIKEEYSQKNLICHSFTNIKTWEVTKIRKDVALG